jgi:hypothetical protein
MRIRASFVCVVFLILMTACTGSRRTGSTQPVDWKQLPGVPVSTGWKPAEQPIVGEGLSLVVYAIEISYSGTTLLYAATGSRVAELADPATTFLLHDDQGRLTKLIAQQIFDITLDQMKFGRLVFDRHPSGVKELVLQINRENADQSVLEGAVALKFGGDDQSEHEDTSYSFCWGKETDLGGYRITSQGWFFPPAQVAIPTEMLYPKEIRSGEAATLRIEDLQSQQVYYLFMRFPSLHETKVVLIQ